MELERFSYDLKGAYDALLRLEHQARRMCDEAIWSVTPGEPTGIRILQLDEDITLTASWAVDHFLDSLRKAQNAVIPYLMRTFRRSLPASLPDLAKNCTSATAVLPDAVCELIREYWSRNGKRVKDYRDFAQHYAVVSADARVAFLPDGRRGLFLVMVSNPERKSLKELVFNAPYVHTLSYCRTAFLTFFSFTYALFYLLARYLGYPKTFTMTLGFKDPLGGSLEGYIVPPSGDLEDQLWSIREQGKPALVEAYGSLDEPTLPRDAG